MLVAASLASTAGNIAHAGQHRDAATAAGALAAAAIPPLALLSLTHLAGLWSRIRTRGVVYWCFLVAVAVIATAAFRLSFAALQDLAVRYGYSRADAALFPLILDGLVAVCTLGLVVLARIEAPHRGDAAVHRDAVGDAVRESAARPDAAGAMHDDADATGSAADGDTSGGAGELIGRGAEVSAPTAASPRQLPAAALTSTDSPTVSREAWWRTAAAHRDAEPAAHRAAEQEHDAHLRLAQRLVDAGRTTMGLDAVHAVLARTAAGQSSRTVATHLGLSPSAVQRVLKAARDEESTVASLASRT